MRLKDSVNPIGLRPELIVAIIVAAEAYEKAGREFVITSLNDSTHSATSLHYAGAAVDIRTRHLALGEPEQIRDYIDERLPTDYDVILEADHIHIEYQPRRR